MVQSLLSDREEKQKQGLSEESEQEILRMVEEQLDRPNPPDTKVLYRRAMHFIDRDVRHLSLQQFNAKFPLQVKRKRARAASEAENGASATATTNGHGDTATDPTLENGHELGDSGSDGDGPEQRDVESTDGDGATEESDSPRQAIPREEIRSALLEYAKLVARAETPAELVEAVPQVDEYVEKVI